jgi:hypothetical protein
MEMTNHGFPFGWTIQSKTKLPGDWEIAGQFLA